MSEVLWRRLGYMLSPQLDIYKAIAPHVAAQTVIDIGFGTGFGTNILTGYAREVVGVEVDHDAINFAADNLPGIQFAWGDISRGVRYLVDDEFRFDAALMIEVLEHVSHWRNALTNVVEILKPGGKLYISARNANADLRKNDLHEREWTAAEFTAALGEFFESVELYDYRLEVKQDTTTRATPLVAVATKGQLHDAERR
jgi:2-polyprenyl-3-methyl-5-hydroxy-6-metoxy-1,4-benzoquinol methylase